jgi:amino acid transporter
VDVVIAFSLIATSFLIWRRAAGREGLRALRMAHGIAAIVPALVLVALWLYRDSLDFNVLLPGLAWRTWIVLYTLPAAITVVSRGERPEAPRAAV